MPSGSTGTDPEEFSREGPQEQPGAGRPSRGDALPWPFPPGGAPAHPSLPLGLPPRLRSAASSPRLARGVWGSRRESHPPHKPCPAPLLLPWPGFWGQTLPGAACSSAIPAAGDTGAAFGCHIPNRGRLCSLGAPPARPDPLERGFSKISSGSPLPWGAGVPPWGSPRSCPASQARSRSACCCHNQGSPRGVFCLFLRVVFFLPPGENPANYVPNKKPILARNNTPVLRRHLFVGKF